MVTLKRNYWTCEIMRKTQHAFKKNDNDNRKRLSKCGIGE